MIGRWVDTLVTDKELKGVKQLWPLHTPKTKEQIRYRKRFDHRYGKEHVSLVPYYRMPKRVKETVDPSARVLEVYDEMSTYKTMKKKVK
jgi:hypothetical protein